MSTWPRAFSVPIIDADGEPVSDRPLIGEIDLVVKDKDGDIVLVDWKTSAAKWPEGKVYSHMQATCFSYGWNRLTGDNPLFRFDVVTKTKKPSYETLATTGGKTISIAWPSWSGWSSGQSRTTCSTRCTAATLVKTAPTPAPAPTGTATRHATCRLRHKTLRENLLEKVLPSNSLSKTFWVICVACGETK